jgi:opacity protein-like surface antigen
VDPLDEPAVSAYQTEDNNTWALAAVGTLPLTKDFSVFGKLGVHNWKKTTNTFVHADHPSDPTQPGPFIRTSSIERGYDPYYGVGVSYALMDGLIVRGEYERYDLDGPKIDFLTAGIAVKF